MKKSLSFKFALCGIFSALAIVSFVIENLFPPLFFPGARMGISNVFILLSLILLGPGYAFITLVLKTMLGSLFAGNVSAILYSLPSGAIALGLEILTFIVLKKVSIVAVSIFGAVINSSLQNLTFCIITNTVEYLYYLPYLALISIVSGLIIGFATYLTIKKFPKNRLEK